METQSTVVATAAGEEGGGGGRSIAEVLVAATEEDNNLIELLIGGEGGGSGSPAVAKRESQRSGNPADSQLQRKRPREDSADEKKVGGEEGSQSQSLTSPLWTVNIQRQSTSGSVNAGSTSAPAPSGTRSNSAGGGSVGGGSPLGGKSAPTLPVAARGAKGGPLFPPQPPRTQATHGKAPMSAVGQTLTVATKSSSSVPSSTRGKTPLTPGSSFPGSPAVPRTKAPAPAPKKSSPIMSRTASTASFPSASRNASATGIGPGRGYDPAYAERMSTAFFRLLGTEDGKPVQYGGGGEGEAESSSFTEADLKQRCEDIGVALAKSGGTAADRAKTLIFHLKDPLNSELRKDIRTGKVSGQELVEMPEAELMNPEHRAKRDEAILERQKSRNWVELKKSQGMNRTTMFRCPKCGKSDCQMIHKQTRSGDEPMTAFLTCQVCGKVFKREA